MTAQERDCRHRALWATLLWGADLGPVTFWRLLQRFGDTDGVLAASERDLGTSALRLRPEQIAAIGRTRGQLARFEAEVHALEASGVRVLCEFDDGYPARLRLLRDRPPVLCVLGETRRGDDLAVAIVGTRRVSAEGRQLCEELAAAFAAEGFAIVSGLARGCDTAAHEGALAAGGRTLAVLGCGISHVYPPENRDLAARIAAHGAVLSEAPPEALPGTARLLARNRLIARLARGVIVVEAGESGGALKTARDALRYSVPVYAVHWRDRGPQTTGTQMLLARGARPIKSADDVADIASTLRIAAPTPDDSPQLMLPVGEV